MWGDSNLLQEAYNRLIEFQLRASPFQSDADRALARQRAQELKLKVSEETAAAYQEWFTLAEAANDIGKVVLELHRPVPGYYSPACSDCLVADGDETVPADWPCTTYLAVKEAINAEG